MRRRELSLQNSPHSMATKYSSVRSLCHGVFQGPLFNRPLPSRCLPTLLQDHTVSQWSARKSSKLLVDFSNFVLRLMLKCWSGLVLPNALVTSASSLVVHVLKTIRLINYLGLLKYFLQGLTVYFRFTVSSLGFCQLCCSALIYIWFQNTRITFKGQAMMNILILTHLSSTTCCCRSQLILQYLFAILFIECICGGKLLLISFYTLTVHISRNIC